MRTPWSSALALLILAPSCIFVASDDSVSPASGTLIVDWSINGLKDPDQCDQGNADAAHIAVISASGSVLGEYEQSCAAFAAAIELHPGEYAVDVVLVDPAGFERTTPVRVRPFTIYGADQLEIPVDFPASSFY